eukprot:gene1206-19842_t
MYSERGADVWQTTQTRLAKCHTDIIDTAEDLGDTTVEAALAAGDIKATITTTTAAAVLALDCASQIKKTHRVRCTVLGMAAGAAIGTAMYGPSHHRHVGRRNVQTTYTTVIQPQPQVVYQAPPVQVVQQPIVYAQAPPQQYAQQTTTTTQYGAPPPVNYAPPASANPYAPPASANPYAPPASANPYAQAPQQQQQQQAYPTYPPQAAAAGGGYPQQQAAAPPAYAAPGAFPQCKGCGLYTQVAGAAFCQGCGKPLH